MMNIESFECFILLDVTFFCFLLCSQLKNKISLVAESIGTFHGLTYCNCPSIYTVFICVHVLVTSYLLLAVQPLKKKRKTRHIVMQCSQHFTFLICNLMLGCHRTPIPASKVLRFFCFYFYLFKNFDTSFFGLLVIRILIASFFCLKL